MNTTLPTRLRAADAPSRELDALIHRAAHPEFADMVTTTENGAVAPGWLAGGDHPLPIEAPHYTSSMDAALTLVPGKCDFIKFIYDPSGSGWEIGRFDPGLEYKKMGEGVTGGLFAIALVLAALAARRIG